MIVKTYDVELAERIPFLVAEKETPYDGDLFKSPKNVADFVQNAFHLERKAEEHLIAVALGADCAPLGIFVVSKGTATSSEFSPREIMIRLLLCGALAFVLVHNHPSGDPKPSSEDVEATEKMKEAGDLIGIKLLDHVIVGTEGFYSFAEKGRI